MLVACCLLLFGWLLPLFVDSCLSLVAACWLVVGCWLFVVGCLLFVACSLRFVVHDDVVRRLLTIVYY